MTFFRQSRIPILLSVAAHVALLFALWLWWQPVKNEIKPTASNQVPKTDRSSEPSLIEQTKNTTDLAIKAPPAGDIPAEDIEVPPNQIRSSVQSKVTQVEKVSNEVKRKHLDRDLSRLQQVSDQKSVNQVTDAVAESMGIDVSQYADKPLNAKGDFDHSTAQIKTVSRTVLEDGKWNYEATMVDAEGRQLKTPLNETEGASIYETFEKLKQYPIAEGLYQKLIMPMLQKMLETDSGG